MKPSKLALLMGEIVHKYGPEATLVPGFPDMYVTATADTDGPYVARLSLVTGMLDWLDGDEPVSRETPQTFSAWSPEPWELS